MADREKPLSPEWWLKRLNKELDSRQEHYELLDEYYHGKPPIPDWVPQQYRADFHRLMDLCKANYMGLVVDAMVERMQIEGFRIGSSPTADETAWRIWQYNNFDTESDKVILEAAKFGHSFVLVAPNPKDSSNPLYTAEHPSQAVVAYEPGSSRRVRVAALKRWVDEWTGMVMATLYLPDKIYKYQANKLPQGVQPKWERRVVRGERWPAPNPLGSVTMIEVKNNPQLLIGGVSEIADLLPIQDRIHKTLCDRLWTQDFGAFPQKWASGYPEEDEDGNPARKIDVGQDKMITSDAAETRFGQFDAAPLDPYSSAKREDVKDIASRSRTPAQYLLGEMSNVNGETLKAAESGLVSKVRQRSRGMGEDFEDVERIGLGAAGKPVPDDTPIETIWKNPEFRTEGELVDALIKVKQGTGLSSRTVWEKWGMSQEEIEKELQRREEEMADPVMQEFFRNAKAVASAPREEPEPDVSDGAPIGG